MSIIESDADRRSRMGPPRYSQSDDRTCTYTNAGLGPRNGFRTAYLRDDWPPTASIPAPFPPSRRFHAPHSPPLPSFPRRREPSATNTRIPQMIANDPHSRSPTTPIPGRQRPRSRARARRSRALARRFHAPPVIPAQAGTQRNQHSHTTDDRQRPPFPSPTTPIPDRPRPRSRALARRFHAPPVDSRAGGNPAQPTPIPQMIARPPFANDPHSQPSAVPAQGDLFV